MNFLRGVKIIFIFLFFFFFWHCIVSYSRIQIQISLQICWTCCFSLFLWPSPALRMFFFISHFLRKHKSFNYYYYYWYYYTETRTQPRLRKLINVNVNLLESSYTLRFVFIVSVMFWHSVLKIYNVFLVFSSVFSCCFSCWVVLRWWGQQIIIPS